MNAGQLIKELLSGVNYDSDGFIKMGSIDHEILLELESDDRKLFYHTIESLLKPIEFVDV